VVENFKVSGLKKYGLDYESLRVINPKLVYCSITGFGQNAPYSDRGGYDFVAQGVGGFMSITGEEHGSLLRAGVAMADLSKGMYATVSIMMALRHAERTGEGQQIDVSLLDTQIAMLANRGMNYLVGNVVPGRLGNHGFAKARAAHGQERIIVNCAGTGNAVKTASRDKATGETKHFPLDASNGSSRST